MSYLTIILEGGPLDGGRVPVTGGVVRYGHILELPYTEVTKRYSQSYYDTTRVTLPGGETVERRERTAIYKCGGDVIADGESGATFVGVLR